MNPEPVPLDGQVGCGGRGCRGLRDFRGQYGEGPPRRAALPLSCRGPAELP